MSTSSSPPSQRSQEQIRFFRLSELCEILAAWWKTNDIDWLLISRPSRAEFRGGSTVTSDSSWSSDVCGSWFAGCRICFRNDRRHKSGQPWEYPPSGRQSLAIVQDTCCLLVSFFPLQTMSRQRQQEQQQKQQEQEQEQQQQQQQQQQYQRPQIQQSRGPVDRTTMAVRDWNRWTVSGRRRGRRIGRRRRRKRNRKPTTTSKKIKKKTKSSPCNEHGPRKWDGGRWTSRNWSFFSFFFNPSWDFVVSTPLPLNKRRPQLKAGHEMKKNRERRK